VFVSLEFFSYPPPTLPVSIFVSGSLVSHLQRFHGVPCPFFFLLFSFLSSYLTFFTFRFSFSFLLALILSYVTGHEERKKKLEPEAVLFFYLAVTGFYIIKSCSFLRHAKFGFIQLVNTRLGWA